MSLIKRVVENVAHFVQRFGSVYESTPLTFPQLDVDKIKLKLRLKEEAMERGAKNLPLPNSKNFDDIELRITSYIDDQIRNVSESYDAYQRAFEERINRLKLSGHIERLEEVAGAAEADFERHVRQSKIEIHTAKNSVEEIEKYVQDFKEKNKLTRPAIYPSSKLLQWAIIFLLLVIETGFNGYFFAKGDELGWLGGISFAIIPSIINIIIAFFLGHYVFKMVIHNNVVKKTAGYFFFVMLFSLVFFINLLVAHYRSVMEIGTLDINAAQVAWHNLKTAPWVLSDIKSWLLLIAGCMCSLIATIDIWSMDDVYLDYGAIDRKRKATIDHYDHISSFAFDDLEDRRDGRLRELEEVRSSTSSLLGMAKSIFDNQNRYAAQYNEYLDHLEGVGKILLSYYRNKNCEARTDGAHPEYFVHEWKLNREKVHIDYNRHAKLIEEMKHDPLKVSGIYTKCIERINRAYGGALKKFQTIDEIKFASKPQREAV